MEGEEVYASDDEMMQDQDGWEDEEYDPDEEDVGWADDSLVLDPEAPEVEDIVLETEEVALPVETNGAIETEDDPNWKRFEILEEAPPVRHSFFISSHRTHYTTTGPPLHHRIDSNAIASFHVENRQRIRCPRFASFEYPRARVRESIGSSAVSHHRSREHSVR